MSDRAWKPLLGRIQMMVGRAVLAAVDDGRTMQALQLELLADETIDGVEHFQPYGLAAHPKPGAEAITVAVGGLRSHAVAIAIGDRRYRLKGLSEGEVALYDDQGQKVLLGRDGIRIESAHGVTIASDGDVAIECVDFTVAASGKAELNSNDVGLGNGAALMAARKTDTVAGGVITGSSTKVRIA